mgnify:CR=1 FL=1
MKIIGGEFLRVTLEAEGYFLKLILNDSVAHFFASALEHRDATQPGICYKDDSLGNALAATIKPGRIDIRFHRAFPDQRVRCLVPDDHIPEEVILCSSPEGRSSCSPRSRPLGGAPKKPALLLPTERATAAAVDGHVAYNMLRYC